MAVSQPIYSAAGGGQGQQYQGDVKATCRVEQQWLTGAVTNRVVDNAEQAGRSYTTPARTGPRIFGKGLTNSKLKSPPTILEGSLSSLVAVKRCLSGNITFDKWLVLATCHRLPLWAIHHADSLEEDNLPNHLAQKVFHAYPGTDGVAGRASWGLADRNSLAAYQESVGMGVKSHRMHH